MVSEFQLHGNRKTRAVGFKRRLHDLHIHHHLVVRHDLLLLAADGTDKVAVEIVHIRSGLGNILGRNGFFVAGRHGLGDTRRRLDGDNVM